MLPLDICSPAPQLHAAAMEADNAFDGAGVDYLVHNAGLLPVWPHALCPHASGLLGNSLRSAGVNAMHPRTQAGYVVIKCLHQLSRMGNALSHSRVRT